MSAEKLPENLYIGKVKVREGRLSGSEIVSQAYVGDVVPGPGMGISGPGLFWFQAQAIGQFPRVLSYDDLVEEALEDWVYETIYVLPVEEEQ